MRNLFKKLLTIILPVFLLVFSTTISFAQYEKVKFGKVSEKELTMMTYEKDSDAAAVVLFDKGRTSFDHQSSEGFKVQMERHIRIKIFNQQGFDWADFEIPYYDSTNGRTKILNLKGVTTYQENGKTVTAKMGKDAIYEEEMSKYWRLKKFTLPQIAEGCVIDVSYTLISDFMYNLPRWQFQYSIPVIWSEYEVEIPEYFFYNKNTMGYVPFTIYDESTSSGFINYTTKTNVGKNIQTEMKNQRLDFRTNITRLAIADVPALKEEPFTSSIDNYYAAVDFELSSTNMPNRGIKKFSADWSSIDEELLKDDGFGALTRKKAFLKTEIANIMKQYDKPKDQITAIYTYVQKKMKWNRLYSIYANYGYSKAFKEGVGSVAEINLMLTTMLINAGFDAAPLVLSTRNHGFIPISRPSLTSFNYVIATVKLDGEIMCFDATSRLLPAGLLPPRCLNGKGRIIRKDACDWLDLSKPQKFDRANQFDLHLNEAGILEGELKRSHKDYAALLFRETMNRKENEETYIEDFQTEREGLKIEGHELAYADLYSKATESYEISYSNGVTDAGGVLYINPFLSEGITENPFKSETRMYPVDFAYPRKEVYVFKMPIPKDYTVEELPEKIIIQTPGKGVTYSYTVTQVANKINIISKMDTKQTIFLPDEYLALRDIYDMIIEKQAEQIVLKKL